MKKKKEILNRVSKIATIVKNKFRFGQIFKMLKHFKKLKVRFGQNFKMLKHLKKLKVSLQQKKNDS